MFVPRHYESLSVLHENTMPERAYYIPASKRMADPVEYREQSDRMQLLNGTWKFQYFESIYDVTDAFYEMGYDTTGMDEITVPSVWQMSGYDRHQYTNIRYPFPFDPPYVPQDNPCGVYVRTFSYQKEAAAPNAFLNFEGVDSCFYVWLNGRYVGYSQVSHMTSEFDITEFLREGENQIAVLVLKWCDGSYLEDQDKFRMSGIFRDVYVLKRPKKAIQDYRIETKIIGNKAQIQVTCTFYEQAAVQVQIEDPSGEVVAEGEIAEDGKGQFEIENPILWNTEQPDCYTIVLQTENEIITDSLALRTIEIRDRVIYFNGQNIKFRGVNRHDSDPVTGFTVGVEQMKKDLTLMKQHNFNAIRTSHYPNVPYFYQMCERYGFLVIDEADIEAHGPEMLYYKEDTNENRFQRWNETLADNPEWEGAIVDRVKRMVQRDKNRFCIVMWSMGNESAYGCNFEKALEWTKQFDPARLTQYESARYRNANKTYQYDNLDLYSRMYPTLDLIQHYLDHDGSKPYLLVEYSHSMGNGPGDFEDYFQKIHSDDRMCGGFVWEWCDHAVAHGQTAEGKTRYFYGGDHGEDIHDGNFCVDGLVYPDRTPHTGLLEYKNVYRPVRIVSYNEESGELILHNYLDFDDICNYADLDYEVTQDGVLIANGRLESISIPPHKDGTLALKFDIPQTGRVYLKLICRLKKQVPLLEKQQELGFEEYKLHNADGRNAQAVKWLEETDTTAKMDVRETEKEVIVTGVNFTYTLDKRTGLFTQMEYAGKAYYNHPMELNIWRAPTDNDMYIKQEWKKAHYPEATTRAYRVETVQNASSVLMTVRAAVQAPTVQKILDVRIIWKIDGNGHLSGNLYVTKNPEFPELPRFGVRLFLNRDLKEATYYGMGPQESYRDKHQGASHGLYRANIRDLHEDYIRPQENGSHYDCDYVELTGSESGIAVAAEQTFSFNASYYTQELLEQAAHNYELTESDSTVLCIDYALNGIGSNSCGPVLLEKYRFDEEKFQMRFTMVPFERK